MQLCWMSKDMGKELWEGYAEKTVINWISVLTSLINLKAVIDTDMGYHVSAIESVVNRLATMSMEIPEPMQVAILLVSLGNLSDYDGAVVVIKTMDSEVATWSNVTIRIIEEQKQFANNGAPKPVDNTKHLLSAKRDATKKVEKDIICWKCNWKGHSKPIRNQNYLIGENRKGYRRKRKEYNQTANVVRLAVTKFEKKKIENHCNETCNNELVRKGKYLRNCPIRKSRKINEITTAKERMFNSDCGIIVDSGASEHVVGDKNFLSEIKAAEEINVEMADRSVVSSRLKVKICVQLYEGIILKVRKVYLVPRSKINLLSCTCLDEKGITALFSYGRCKFLDRDAGNSIIGYANRRNSDNLYCASLIVQENGRKVIAAPVRRVPYGDLDIWHMRMGHAGKSIIEAMCANEKYKMSITEKPVNNGCCDCDLASQTKSAMKGKLVTDEDDITIHTEICGPLEVQTFGGKKYFVTFTIAKLRYCNVALLSRRYQVGNHLEEFVAWVEHQAGTSVKRVHSDNAKEFKALVPRMKARGINCTFSSVYTLQSNGLAERMNRTLLNKTRAMLKCAGLSKSYWGEALLHATYVYNRTMTNSLKGKSPYEQLLGKTPDNSNLRVFGSPANVYIHREQGHGKLRDRSSPGVLLSHEDGIYRVQVLKNRKVVESRHVIFREKVFPMVKKSPRDFTEEEFFEPDFDEESMSEEDDVATKVKGLSTEEETETAEVELPRYPRRENREPERFIAGAMRRTFTDDEPTLRMALQSDEEPLWRKAIEIEIKTLKNMKRWIKVKRPQGKPVLHSKFVLKRKRNGDGTVSKYKARLIVCGNEDAEVQLNSFAPVIDFSSVKLFLAIEIQRKLIIRQLNFENAFVNGNLEREVFVEFRKYIYN